MPEKPLILIADDESHIRHVVRLKLGNAGYDIMTAEDGEEALSMVQEHLPDLLITDYQMPFMTGLELCIEMKKDAELSHIPAIMLTARGSSLEQSEMAMTNIHEVLSKPFSPREVLAVVERLLGSDVQPKVAP